MYEKTLEIGDNLLYIHIGVLFLQKACPFVPPNKAAFFVSESEQMIAYQFYPFLQSL